MTTDNRTLTDEQKMLLRTLVRHARQGEMQGRVTPFPTGRRPDEYVIHLQNATSIVLQGKVDLDVLCDAGLLGWQWDRFGHARLYQLIDSSYEAIDTDFASLTWGQAPKERNPFDAHVIFHAMSGGRIIPDAIARLPHFEKAMEDVVARLEWYETLIAELLNEIKPLLPRKLRIQYDSAGRELLTMLKSGYANPNTMRSRVSDLAFTGSIRPEERLASRAWPYIYLLMLIIEDCER